MEKALFVGCCLVGSVALAVLAAVVAPETITPGTPVATGAALWSLAGAALGMGIAVGSSDG